MRTIAVPISGCSSRAGRDGAPLSLVTVRGVHAILHKALGDARRAGYLTVNPADDATVPRLDPRRDLTAPPLRTWTAAELRRFLAATAGTSLGPLWAVAAGTGMRRGELLALRWVDVDLDACVAQVRLALTRLRGEPRLKDPKGGRARRLRVDGHVRAALQEQRDRQASDARRHGPLWRNDWDLVFTTTVGAPWHPDAISRAFRRACLDAGAPVLRLHGLRHTHARSRSSASDCAITRPADDGRRGRRPASPRTSTGDSRAAPAGPTAAGPRGGAVPRAVPLRRRPPQDRTR